MNNKMTIYARPHHAVINGEVVFSRRKMKQFVDEQEGEIIIKVQGAVDVYSYNTVEPEEQTNED